MGWLVRCTINSDLIVLNVLLHSTPKSLVDTSGKVFGQLAGRPKNDPKWDKILEGAMNAIREARGLLRFGRKQMSDRRGPFPTFAFGISYGGGQEVRLYH